MVDNIGGSALNNYDHACNHAGQGDMKISKQPDQLLPIANVGRIMKQILPPNAKISKEAKQTMQECVSGFISFITAEASNKCREERRKTVNGEDICWALGSLGFDDYTGLLRRYLHRYRDEEGAEHGANGNYNNEEKLKLLQVNNNMLSTDQDLRIIMILNQYDHPHHERQKT